MILLDLAEGIHFELGEPADPSIVKILKWNLFHLGDLNDLLGLEYSINGNTASPELTDDVAVIYAALYMNDYYAKQIRNNLGAANWEIVEVKEADSSVRVASKTEISKTYLQLKNQNTEYFTKLVQAWRVNRCVPASLHNSFYCGITKTLQQP